MGGDGRSRETDVGGGSAPYSVRLWERRKSPGRPGQRARVKGDVIYAGVLWLMVALKMDLTRVEGVWKQVVDRREELAEKLGRAVAYYDQWGCHHLSGGWRYTGRPDRVHGSGRERGGK